VRVAKQKHPLSWTSDVQRSAQQGAPFGGEVLVVMAVPLVWCREMRREHRQPVIGGRQLSLEELPR